MMRRKSMRPGVAAALALLFSACAMPGPEHNPGQDGKAAVRVGVAASGIQARTILPTLPSADLSGVTNWELSGGAVETKLAEFTGTSTTVSLATGVWDFTLKGYENNDLILQGSLTGQTITLDGPNSLPFEVAPVAGGTGTLKITVNLPGEHGITKADAYKDGVLLGQLPIVAEKVVLEGSYPAGDYYFRIELYMGGDLYGVVSETAQIRSKLESAKEYTLSLADLNRTYTITYHLNGGGGVISPGYYHSTDADLTLPTPTRAGYTFASWLEGSASGSVIASIPQGSTGNRVFYATWTPVSYDITYGMNGGTNDGANPAAYTIESFYIALAAPHYDDHSFAGWYSDSVFTNRVYGILAGSTGDKTFYAKWASGVSVEITLSSAPTDPSLSDTEIYKSAGGSFTVAGTWTGYTWQWYWDGKLINGEETDTYVLAANAKPFGIYELSVVATPAAGSPLSARCLVAINEDPLL
jgi:uncharacterized repeat protein (TIGR02543 family)